MQVGRPHGDIGEHGMSVQKINWSLCVAALVFCGSGIPATCGDIWKPMYIRMTHCLSTVDDSTTRLPCCHPQGRARNQDCSGYLLPLRGGARGLVREQKNKHTLCVWVSRLWVLLIVKFQAILMWCNVMIRYLHAVRSWQLSQLSLSHDRKYKIIKKITKNEYRWAEWVQSSTDTGTLQKLSLVMYTNTLSPVLTISGSNDFS